MSTTVNSETGPKRPKKVNTQTTPQPRIEEREDTPTKENKPDLNLAAGEGTNPTIPAKERRKPRKLVRSTPSSPSVPKTPGEQIDTPESADTLLESRLQKLEQQYHSINKRLDTNAREIGRLQASSKSQKPGRPSTDSTTHTPPPQEENLQNTASSLEQVGRKQRGRVVEEDDDIETIPRLDGGPVAEQRSVALTGNYKIPLPSTFSTDDVRAIQSGIAAAGTVAREITAAIRTNGLPQQGGSGTEIPQPGPQMEKDPTETPKSPKSWSAFLSDCSKLVANAANAIEMDAAVEAGKKPAAPTGRQISGAASSASTRPSARGNGNSYQSPTKSSAARKQEKGLPDFAIASEEGKTHRSKGSVSGEGRKYAPRDSVSGKSEGVPKAG